MPGEYASSTDTSSASSRAEIERTVLRFGADQFAYFTGIGQAAVAFVLHDRQVRFTISLPDRNDSEFTRTPGRGFERSAKAAVAAYEQAVKQKWRALNLVIKAKLVAVDEGIVTFEQEFGMHFVLPGGQTVADLVVPYMTHAIESGDVAPMMALPSPNSKRRGG